MKKIPINCIVFNSYSQSENEAILYNNNTNAQSMKINNIPINCLHWLWNYENKTILYNNNTNAQSMKKIYTN